MSELQALDSPTSKTVTRIPQVSHATTRIASPRRPGSPVRALLSPVALNSPMHKDFAQHRPRLTERAINKKTDGPVSPTYMRKKRSDTISSIPQPPRHSLQGKDRPVTSHGLDFTVRRERALSTPQKPQRVRMQSPQKVSFGVISSMFILLI